MYSDGKGRWRVDRLIELSKDLPVFEMEVKSFRELDWNVWFKRNPTIREILEHMSRIEKADLQYPIILSSAGIIMDGCHRLAKAYMNNHEKIRVVQFQEDPDPDF